MRRRNPLIVTAASGALFLAGLVPAAAAADSDIVDRFHNLQASGIITLTPDGRAHAGAITGTEVVVNAVGDVIEQLPFVAKALDRPLGASIADVPCVHDTEREGFQAYLPPAEYPVNKRNDHPAARQLPEGLGRPALQVRRHGRLPPQRG
ncbi:MAG: hypothetical protein ACRDZ3_04970, partial [Acidimicrobiia bacterium]